MARLVTSPAREQETDRLLLSTPQKGGEKHKYINFCWALLAVGHFPGEG